MTTPWPTELRLKKKENCLLVTFDDGKSASLSALRLRENSPSAEVKGHGGKKPDVKIDPAVRIEALEPVGNYAVRIIFSDGHSTGLYSWEVLYELALSKFV
jgi:DUF971 family protein